MSFNLKRRTLIKAGAATLLAGSAVVLYDSSKNKKLNNVNLTANKTHPGKHKSIIPSISRSEERLQHEIAVRDNLLKVKNFDQTFANDIFLADDKMIIFQNTSNRILRVQKVIGYANFNLVSFDNMLLYAHRYPKIGKFRKEELDLIDELFFYDANKYGFHGNKVIKDLTSNINKNEMFKIKGSGHYLFRGDALNKFNQLKKDIGNELILTSGVRSVVKQLQLFLAKLNKSKGNLSLASRSLAPPGHSYHGIGDFDVGKKGFGKLNFTSKFSNTKEYEKLIELKYVDLRYTKDNQVGVRYEPWHIKVV